MQNCPIGFLVTNISNSIPTILSFHHFNLVLLLLSYIIYQLIDENLFTLGVRNNTAP